LFQIVWVLYRIEVVGVFVRFSLRHQMSIPTQLLAL
jgi:hypothetical protein